MNERVITVYRFFPELLGDIDATALKWDKQKTADILKWFLLGFKEDFISHIQPEGFSNIELIRHGYVKSLTIYITILKSGLVTEEREG